MIFLKIILAFLMINAEELKYTKIDHQGCPENSQCLESTGKTREQFVTLLKSFKKNKINKNELNSKLKELKAFPLPIYSTSSNDLVNGLSLWQSQCKTHKKRTTPIFLGEILIESIDQEKMKAQKFIPHEHFVFYNNQYTKTFGLLGEAPVFAEIDQKNLVVTFFREEDGEYYYFKVINSKEIEIDHHTKGPVLPESIICSKEHVDYFVKNATDPRLYDSVSCKRIKNVKNESDVIIVYGSQCI